MTDKIISDIELFMLTTIEPTFEPTTVVTITNQSDSLKNNELTNYEKRIVIFTSLGGLMILFMLVALFFHIKSRLLRAEQNKKLDNELLDIINSNVTELVINEKESNI
jgi:hypothetical protein